MSAKAAPRPEASTAPTKAAPSILSALPRETVPLANPLVNSSKELSLAVVAQSLLLQCHLYETTH